MAINLKKGESINLSKREPNLRKIKVGLGWDKKADSGADFDLDVSVFVCRLNESREPKLLSDEYFVFYNNKVSPDGAVTHSGDNRTGDAAGDDESILVDLSKINAQAQEISFVVTIHEAEARHQSFGQIQNAYIRLYDNDKVVADYDLDEMFSNETAVQFGSFFKLDNEWLFKAVGAGYRLNLGDFVEGYQ
ncbi:MAG: TerD family protein [Agitococcus sp.]